jgi:ech hydrogenase subunit D
MRNLKVMVEKDDNVKSISTIYPGAFLIENEVQDLFGLTFEGLTIDYKKKLFMVPGGPEKPMA